MNEKKVSIFKPMMIMLIFLGSLFGGIFIYKFYGSYMMKKSMEENAMPPIAVSTATVSYESWQSKISATATVRAINGVDVTSEVAGLVKTIKQDAGKDVKVGEVLVELNADVEIAHLHSLEADAALAEVVYKRDKSQYAIQGVSKATLDSDEATLKSKTAQVVEQAAVVAKKTICAPFDGRLGIINVNLGQFLNPGDNIATLQSLDPIYVDFVLPQQEFPLIKKNQPITFTTDTYPGEKFTGKITSMNPKVDVATRTVTVEATLSNSERKILPGMYGVVDITTASPKDYFTAPQTAISYNPYGDYVYILKDEKKDKQGKSTFVAYQKFVTLGKTRGDQVQILKGIEKGDRIVTAGQLKLKNGSLTFINNKIPLSNSPNPILKERGE
jgi:membrane fusion protein (multidrug efflux system)